MTRENRKIWAQIERAHRLEEEKSAIMHRIFESFSDEELETVNLGASNSSNLGETICCYVDYGEDGEKISTYLERRG